MLKTRYLAIVFFCTCSFQRGLRSLSTSFISTNCSEALFCLFTYHFFILSTRCYQQCGWREGARMAAAGVSMAATLLLVLATAAAGARLGELARRETGDIFTITGQFGIQLVLLTPRSGLLSVCPGWKKKLPFSFHSSSPKIGSWHYNTPVPRKGRWSCACSLSGRNPRDSRLIGLLMRINEQKVHLCLRINPCLCTINMWRSGSKTSVEIDLRDQTVRGLLLV